jgi:hypothetical protein
MRNICGHCASTSPSTVKSAPDSYRYQQRGTEKPREVPRTGARVGHRLAVVREALEPLEEERTGALQRINSLRLLFLLVQPRQGLGAGGMLRAWCDGGAEDAVEGRMMMMRSVGKTAEGCV